MAFITVQVDSGSLAVADSNELVLKGDTTKPQEIITNLVNFLQGLQLGMESGTVSISTSTVAGTVSGQTGGTAAFTITFN
jgi:hypothetical protein